MIIQR